MDKKYTVEFKNGCYLFKLEQLLKEKNISKYRIMTDTQIDYKVLKRIWSGELTRIDITVLARLRDYLDCEITDIFEYKKKDNH